MGARKKPNRCKGCGVELRFDATSCPLCGAERDAAPERAAVEPVLDAEEYRSTVRELREQLRRLRDDGAEAV